jgi:hypothetical protein
MGGVETRYRRGPAKPAKAVENPDPTTLGQYPHRFPQKVVIQFLGTRVFETEHPTALRFDARHHILMALSLPAASFAWKISSSE